MDTESILLVAEDLGIIFGNLVRRLSSIPEIRRHRCPLRRLLVEVAYVWGSPPGRSLGRPKQQGSSQ